MYSTSTGQFRESTQLPTPDVFQSAGLLKDDSAYLVGTAQIFEFNLSAGVWITIPHEAGENLS
jgi:hypothetical protein